MRNETGKIAPFSVSDSAASLQCLFPSAEYISSHFNKLSYDEKVAFIRFWLAEGFPAAFERIPMIYQLARRWLANELYVKAEEIILIGSGKVGFSLVPGEAYGKPFSNESDLDFALISNEYFNLLEKAFFAWLGDYRMNEISPNNSKQQMFWASNAEKVPKNISSGFIDHYKIPYHEKYQPAGKTQDAICRLGWKIQTTANCPSVKNISLRVYKNWDSFVRRMLVNLTAIRVCRE